MIFCYCCLFVPLWESLSSSATAADKLQKAEVTPARQLPLRGFWQCLCHHFFLLLKPRFRQKTNFCKENHDFEPQSNFLNMEFTILHKNCSIETIISQVIVKKPWFFATIWCEDSLIHIWLIAYWLKNCCNQWPPNMVNAQNSEDLPY